MAENTDGNEGGNIDTGGADGGAEFKAITSQDDLNRIITERVSRERAKFADYKDVKAKAGRLDEIEAANKTEAQRLADEKVAAEKERDQARAEALRMRVASKHGISDEDADLFLTGTDEDTLTKQAERLSQRSEDRKRQGNVAPKEGRHTDPPSNDSLTTVRELFG